MSTDNLITQIVYRELARFPGYYFGDDGSVWSLWFCKPFGIGYGTKACLGTEWKRLSLNTSTSGYLSVMLKEQEGKPRRFQVHRLILEAFVGPPPFSWYQACHKDGNRRNNRLNNLRWDTPAGNQADYRGRRQLTEADVYAIRSMRKRGWPLMDIAEIYDIHKPHVCRIAKRQAWSQLPEKS